MHSIYGPRKPTSPKRVATPHPSRRDDQPLRRSALGSTPLAPAWAPVRQRPRRHVTCAPDHCFAVNGARLRAVTRRPPGRGFGDGPGPRAGGCRAAAAIGRGPDGDRPGGLAWPGPWRGGAMARPAPATPLPLWGVERVLRRQARGGCQKPTAAARPAPSRPPPAPGPSSQPDERRPTASLHARCQRPPAHSGAQTERAARECLYARPPRLRLCAPPVPPAPPPHPAGRSPSASRTRPPGASVRA